MTNPAPESQEEFLKRMRQQYDFDPYPHVSIEKLPNKDSNTLFIHDLTTAYYLRDRKAIDTSQRVILDAGCGTGYKSLLLAIANPGSKVIGIDISRNSIEIARERIKYHNYQDHVEFHLIEIKDLPKLNLTFDYINCDEVLYFSTDIIRDLSIFKEHLKPTGILRSNLHSSLQRQHYFRAQEFLDLIGLMDDDAEEIAVPITIEIMKALNPLVDLKRYAWQGEYEVINDNNKNGFLLSNHLMKEDKGYRVSDLFRALEASELDFLSMVNWRHWNVADLFQEPDDLPAYLAMGLADSSPEILLTIYELLNPVHRLLDFWCTHPRQGPEPLPVGDWTLADWHNSQITLHPQLRTEAFQKAALEAIQNNGSFAISSFLSLPTLSPVTISYDVVALLLQLWDGPKPFTTLVEMWQRTHPLNWITLEPITPEATAQQVADALGKLEVFLYVLPEQMV